MSHGADADDGAAPTRNNIGVFSALEGHEQVVYGSDADTGLRAIVAIHSTALGPALGGTRFYPYIREADALHDVLRLSKAMSYKNALARLPHGGGKAVILGDPTAIKNDKLMLAYGRLVEQIAGRYITACDVGTTVADMDVVAAETRHVTGRSVEAGGAGDSSVLTAFGVFQGMRACAQYCWGDPSLRGRRVAVDGVGKVGSRLVGHVVDDGAAVVIHDVNPAAVQSVISRHPQVKAVGSAEALIREAADIWSPNALGGALNEKVADELGSAIVCGGANNQLADNLVAEQLLRQQIVYAPDYLVNAGGVIQVADELLGFSHERARARAASIYATTLEVLQSAADQQISPAVAADRLAEELILSGRSARSTSTPG